MLISKYQKYYPVIFLVVLLCVIHFTGFMLCYGLKYSNNEHWGVWKNVISAKTDADILITGSSRALVHFDSEIFRERLGLNTKVIALDGCAYFRLVPILEFYLENNNAPKILIIESSYTPLLLSEENDYRLLETSLPYFENKNLYNYFKNEEKFFINHIFPINLFLTRDNLFYYSLTGFLKINDLVFRDGYFKTDLNWDRNIPDNKTLRKIDYFDSVIVSKNIKSIVEIINIFRSKGSHVIMVNTPEYYLAKETMINRDTIISKLKTVSEAYKIPFWDFSDFEVSKDSRYFYDFVHLNRKGAELFTFRLIDTLGKSIK